MRRRRLIGMYRVLLKSMNLVCSGCQEERPTTELPRRPGTKKQNENLAWNRPYPIGLFSTIDPASRTRVLPRLTSSFGALFPWDFLYDLGIKRPRRNAPALGPKRALPEELLP